jgi:hypothetical protein
MRISGRLTGIAVAVALLVVPGSAGAAIVNNGDFETGNLSGWQKAIEGPADWFAYSGTVAPIGMNTVPAPPQGAFAAIADQQNISRQILYQDVALPPAGSQVRLSLIAYYTSDEAIVSPDTLDINVVNQQYRIDVMRPGAAVDSVASGDVLATVLRTQTGATTVLSPTPKTADLSAFAGQSVRLRFAVATTNDNLNGGADAVTVNGLTVGQATRNMKNGTATLPVTVTDAGTVALAGNGVKPSSASKSVAVPAGTTNLLVKAQGKKKKKLNRKGKVKVNVTVTYTPTGAAALSEQAKVKLKKKTKKG